MVETMYEGTDCSTPGPIRPRGEAARGTRSAVRRGSAGRRRTGIGTREVERPATSAAPAPSLRVTPLPVGSLLRVALTLQVVWGRDVKLQLCGGGDVRHLHHKMKGSDGYGAWGAFRTDAPVWTEERRDQTDALGLNDVSGGNEVKALRSNWNARPAMVAPTGNGCAI